MTTIPKSDFAKGKSKFIDYRIYKGFNIKHFKNT